MSLLLDPDDIADIEFDWSARLSGSETINSAIVTATGLTVAPGGRVTSVNSPRVIVWLTGGTSGQRYDVKCTVTTSAGRQYDHTARVTVLHR